MNEVTEDKPSITAAASSVPLPKATPGRYGTFAHLLILQDLGDKRQRFVVNYIIDEEVPDIPRLSVPTDPVCGDKIRRCT
jgi:hypothetical protein